MTKPREQPPLYEPTESQIAAETALIRADWTEAEHLRRANKHSVSRPTSYRLWAEIEVVR